MKKQKQQQPRLSEDDIFQLRNEDINKAFIEVYKMYVAEMYRYAFFGLYHHTRLAEQTTEEVFYKAFKFFHSFQPGTVSYRAYLYSLVVPLVVKQRTEFTTDQTKKIRLRGRKYTEADQRLWQAIQSLEPVTFTIFELWHGAHLAPPEIALAVRFDIAEVIRRYEVTQLTFSQLVDNYHAGVQSLYEKRDNTTILTISQERKIIEKIVKWRRKAPSFVQTTWWSSIVGPIPFSFALCLAAIVLGVLWYVQRPEPLTDMSNTNLEQAFFVKPSVEQRPRAVISQGHLPEVVESRRLLSQVDGNLYGTQYVQEGDIDTTTVEQLTPDITINIPVNEYKDISEAYVYAVPEALPEEQLQLAAFDHFSSLPLNQFTYVNGTYYIEESADDFRPLFIAFNNDGSIEYQMRQLAICGLADLTTETNEETARTAAFDFLASHNFVFVESTDLRIERTSEVGHTLPKDVFCGDGDSSSVFDHEFVFFAPHTVIRYNDGAEDVLPMRMPGIATHTHSNAVTNMRIDPLYSLQDQIVRTEKAELIDLETAVTRVQEFYYPASDDVGEHERFQVAFPQWYHQSGNQRLQSMTINQVRLEYVYDELNNTIEPYYVFSGTGFDGTNEDPEMRMYIAAVNQDVELRGPYRQ